MKIALVGLPGSGKTTLYSALTGIADPGPHHQIHEPFEASVAVPDERLELLREHFHPKKFTPANLLIEDFPGFPVSDNADGKSRFVAAIREADAFAVVLQGFPTPGLDDVPNPVRDREKLMEEFAIGDLAQVEKRVERLQKDVLRGNMKTREEDKKELAVLERILPALYDGKTVRDIEMSDEEARPLRGFRFLTAKPRLFVLNHIEGAEAASLPACAPADEPQVALAATVEKELACMADSDRAEFMEMLNVTEVARPRLLRAAYATLGLASFFTVGEDEVRAWTIPQNCPAVEAAGRVHSDIQRGFIRAEVVSYDDYVKCGGLKEAKAKNLMRLEGKEYPVADGDIINFRFSV